MLYPPGTRVQVRQFCGVVVGYARHGAEETPGTLRLRLDNGTVVFLPVTAQDLPQEARPSIIKRVLTRDVPGPVDRRRQGRGR